MHKKYDLIVVGGGVLGTFHAYHALEHGLSVAVIEKDKQPQRATVRNFGQVVPSGMNTKWQNYGRESLDIYRKIQDRFDISVRQNGSVYLASGEEEVLLIEELRSINQRNGYTSQLLTRQECLERYPGLKPDYVKAGLFFPDEVTVEPKVMIGKLQQYLVKEKALDYYDSTNVIRCTAIAGGITVQTSKGITFEAVKVVICCGSEFKTLYPQLFAGSDLEVTKLQMLQTVPQSGYQLKGSILTGLSIRRYEAFYECPSFAAIKAKEDPHALEKQWGIHILFKQAVDGSVIIGDSHEYADAAHADDLGFDLRADVDAFMIAEAQKIFELPSYEIRNRWYGIYSQCKRADLFQHTIDGSIHIVTGIGGKGMTGSAGFAKENIKKIFDFK